MFTDVECFLWQGAGPATSWLTVAQDRDRGEEDWAFSAPSQVTYYMQHLVMAGVMADAAMVDGAIERDVYCRRDPEELRGG